MTHYEPDDGVIHEISLADQIDRATTIGERLRIARTNAGLTLAQAAKLRDFSTANISAEESGHVEVPSHMVAWAARTYGVRYSWLARGHRGPVNFNTGGLAASAARDIVALLSICGDEND